MDKYLKGEKEERNQLLRRRRENAMVEGSEKEQRKRAPLSETTREKKTPKNKLNFSFQWNPKAEEVLVLNPE